MLKSLQLLLGAMLAMAVSFAQAALPSDVSTAFTGLTTDGASLMTLIWGAVAVFSIGFVWIKLFKKGLNKAT